jgi:hypothetical protein
MAYRHFSSLTRSLSFKSAAVFFILAKLKSIFCAT